MWQVSQLSLLATEVDSLEKARVLAQAERDREAKRRTKVETEAHNLRAELDQARRRAKAAERELAKLSASVEATSHHAEAHERELRARLDDGAPWRCISKRCSAICAKPPAKHSESELRRSQTRRPWSRRRATSAGNAPRRATLVA